MFKLDQVGRTIVSALAALIVTTTMVGSAVGPARAVETTPAAEFQLIA